MDKRKEFTGNDNVMRQFTEINPFAKYDDLMASIGSGLKAVAEYKNPIVSVRGLKAVTEYKNPMASITSLFNTSAFKMLDQYKNQPARVKSALDVLSKSTLAPPAHPMPEANKSILAMNREGMFLNSMTPSLLQDHQRIQEAMKNLSAPLDTSAMLPASLAAQSKLFELQRFPLGAEINAAAVLQDSLRLNLDRFTANYRRLVDFTDYQSAIIETLRPDIIQYPSHEVFRETELLEQITVPEDEQVVSDEYEVIPIPEERPLEDWLGEINSGFPSLLRGAHAALNANNPDRARHVASSLRELIGHVLRRLAPDDKIRVWKTDSNYYHNDRPTRRSRLLYICREIDFDDLSEFVNADVKSALTLIDALHAEAHVISRRLTDRQLQALVDRTVSLLLFLLRLNSTNN